MTTGKTIALTRWNFVIKVMSLPFNTLSRSVITFLPRSKCLLISWLQSPSAMILAKWLSEEDLQMLRKEEKPKAKRKDIYLFECRVPENSKER